MATNGQQYSRMLLFVLCSLGVVDVLGTVDLRTSCCACCPAESSKNLIMLPDPSNFSMWWRSLAQSRTELTRYGCNWRQHEVTKETMLMKYHNK